MNLRVLVFAACILAAFVFTEAPASAQSLSVGGVSVGSNGGAAGTTNASAADPGGTGSTGTASASGGSALGGTGDTTANIGLGGGGTTAGTGPVTGVATLGSGTTTGTPSGSVALGTGTTPAGGGNTATLSLNPDGTISVSTGTPGAPTGTPGQGTTVTTSQIQTALASLDNADVAALKLKCGNVLANPGAFDAATVAICKALGGR